MDSETSSSPSESESVLRMAFHCDDSSMGSEISQRIQTLKGKSSEISILLQRILPQDWDMDAAAGPSSLLVCDTPNIRSEFKERMQAVVFELEGMLYTVMVQELSAWKTEQRKSKCTHIIPKKSLASIEMWCEELTELIWKTGEQVQEAERLGILEIRELQLRVKTLLDELIKYSLIIVEHPLQVVKKGTKCPKSIVLLLLCGSIFKHAKLDLSKAENQPLVEMSLINDIQARILIANNTRPTKISGSCQKNFSKLELQGKGNAGRVVAVFRVAKISKVDEGARKGSISSPKSDAVTDTKFCLHFYCEFRLENCHFKISTMSSPLVIVTHGSQDSQAWGTINWDNAFHEQNRLPFEVPSKVSWAQISELLHCIFKDATEGRGLNDDNMQYLKAKVMSIGSPSNSEIVSWTRFCKSIIPERTFSFWDWFYANLKLTERNAKIFWNEGYINGFIGKTEAENLIAPCLPGTFLLRFSDTALGGISIVLKDTDGLVKSYAPFNSKQLSSKSLADTLKDLENLQILYPNTPKDFAFGNHYTKENVSTIPSSQGKGYIVVKAKYIAYSTSPDQQQTVAAVGQPTLAASSQFAFVQQSLASVTATTSTNPHLQPAQFSTEATEPLESVMYNFDDDHLRL